MYRKLPKSPSPAQPEPQPSPMALDPDLSQASHARCPTARPQPQPEPQPSPMALDPVSGILMAVKTPRCRGPRPFKKSRKYFSKSRKSISRLFDASESTILKSRKNIFRLFENMWIIIHFLYVLNDLGDFLKSLKRLFRPFQKVCSTFSKSILEVVRSCLLTCLHVAASAVSTVDFASQRSVPPRPPASVLADQSPCPCHAPKNRRRACTHEASGSVRSHEKKIENKFSKRRK